MSTNAFAFDQARLGAAIDLHLQPEHFDEFQRLSKTLVHGPRFQFVIVDCEDERLRERLLAALIDVLCSAGLTASKLSLGPEIDDVPQLEARLVEEARGHAVVHILDAVRWFNDARWEAFNVRRERVAHAAPARLVFWLTPEAVRQLSLLAPDVWAWRAGVYAFNQTVAFGEPSSASTATMQPHEGMTTGIDVRNNPARHRRIAELRTVLDSRHDLDDESRGVLLDELAELQIMRGDLDEALRILKAEMLPAFERLGNMRSKAVTQGKIADILQARGDLDGALRIREEEELPVYEQQNDVREEAVTQGKIADILQVRGQLDEALRILEAKVLPAFEELGDLRSKAVTQCKIADIFRVRGQLDKALRIYEEEGLPIYERLGDAREEAVTQGKIADILQVRGQLDEALRIREEEELPVYERQGDVRSKAITQGKIADILRSRGQLDEALRFLEVEVLPIFEQLGDVRSKAITQGRIADILQSLGHLDEALRIREEEELPVYERLGDVRSKAITQGRIADILQSLGQLDEALRIREEEELSVYERLGDARSKAITQGRIADILQSRGQLVEALALQELRLLVAECMGDLDSIAHISYSIALLHLQRGDHQIGGLQKIYDSLSRAYAISRQLDRPDAIGSIGALLAQVLAMRGLSDEVPAVLDAAEAAWARLGDEAKQAHVRALREQLIR